MVRRGTGRAARQERRLRQREKVCISLIESRKKKILPLLYHTHTHTSSAARDVFAMKDTIFNFNFSATILGTLSSSFLIRFGPQSTHDLENVWNNHEYSLHSSHNLPLFSAIRAFPRDPAELTHPLIQILRVPAQARSLHGPA